MRTSILFVALLIIAARIQAADPRREACRPAKS